MHPGCGEELGAVFVGVAILGKLDRATAMLLPAQSQSSGCNLSPYLYLSGEEATKFQHNKKIFSDETLVSFLLRKNVLGFTEDWGLPGSSPASV